MYTGGTRRRRGSSAPAQDGRLQFATESTRTIHEAEHQGWATFTPWRLSVILRDSNNVQHVVMNGSQRTLSAQTKMNHDGVQYILDCNADGRTDGNTGRTWTLMVDHNNMNYERSMSNCFLNIKFIDTSINSIHMYIEIFQNLSRICACSNQPHHRRPVERELSKLLSSYSRTLLSPLGTQACEECGGWIVQRMMTRVDDNDDSDVCVCVCVCVCMCVKL